MITLNIPRIARIMGIQRPYTFLVQQGFTKRTAKDLLAGRTKRLAFAHLEKLCRIFQCEPYDLYDYSPDKNRTYVGEDRLAFLTKPKGDASIHTLTAGLSFAEMQALLAEVAQRNQAA